MLVEPKAKEVSRAAVSEVSEPALNLFSAVPDSAEMRRVAAWLDGRFKTAKKVMTSETVTITPAMAEYILKRCNAGNRPLRKSKIEQYAKAMKEGLFLLTSQGISFDPDGTLNNGQHRLHGIVRSGMPIRMYVTFGESKDAFHVIDTGGVRGAADSLYVAGHKNVNVLASSARLLKIIEDRATKGSYSNKQMIEFVESHAGLPHAVTAAWPVYNKFRCSIAAPTVACYFIITKSRRPELLASFTSSLVDGTNLAKGSALLKFREGLMQKKLDTKCRDSFTRGASVAASMIIAWNSWAYDRPIRSVLWDHNTPFPTVG